MFANRTPMFIGSLSLVSFLGGCSVPIIEEPEFGSNSGTDEGGSDEFGAANDEDGGGDGGGEGEASAKAHNTCLTGPEEGRYAFRHHCGGNLEFRITASADGEVINKVYDYGFGPGFVDNDLEGLDTYASPMVAACCGGPYDFDMPAVDQSTYWENCKLDAVQQMCSATGQWMLKLAEQYPLAAGKLKDAAATLGSAAVQTECVLALYEAGEFDDQGEPLSDRHYRMINDTQWSVEAEGASMLVEIDLLEILALDYPEPPQTCESLFENDTTLLPLLEALGDNGGGQVHPLLSAGLAVTDDADFYQQFDADNGGVSIELLDGAVKLSSLVIRDTQPTTASFGSTKLQIDGWSLTLLGEVTGSDQHGVFVFDAGEALFSLSFSEYGDLRRTAATNAGPFTLQRSSEGQWLLEDLDVDLEDASGIWSLRSTEGLIFGPPSRR